MAEELNLTDEEQEKLVFGYIRGHEYLIVTLVPIAVINLFVTWYKCFPDQWQIDESSHDLYIKNQLLMNETNSSQWFNAYGTQIIGYGQKKIWKLKINSNNATKISARIGIIDASQVENDVDIQSFEFIKMIMKRNSSRKHGSFDQDFVGSFAMSGVSGNFWYWMNSNKRENKRYAEPLKDNDIIIMELDLMQKFCLKFIINQHHFGIAQKSIDYSKQYKLAVAVNREESITLLQ